MPEKYLNNEFSQFFIKVLFPAFLAIGMKIAIEMKKSKEKISIINVILSLVIGLGGAVLSSGLVQVYFTDNVGVPLVTGAIAIMSEKIAEWMIYKLNIDNFLTALADMFFDFILNLKNKK